jgi:serine/threonine-protein kinase
MASDAEDDTLRSTLAPRLATPDSAGRRAMGDLQKLSELSPPRIGQALVVEEAIGWGGMGVVHAATQTSIGRKVAVKMLRPEQRNQAQAMHLLREAWVTGRLEHPSVVPIYDVSLDDSGQPVIVLRRIEGMEWGALLDEPDEVRRRFAAHDHLEWNLRILIQVCNAVHFAHQRGILHRDLKPENVMVGELGEVYVLDWGIAVSMNDDGSGRLPLLRDAREVAGTPYYMAPEMWSGDPSRLSPRTDVYLLGAILYEVATGKPPRHGHSITELSARASEPLVLSESLPPGLAEICRRALAVDPNDRPESALALRRELESYLERRSSELILAEAARAVKALEAELLLPKPRRDAAYNLFGACRFGFEQVLSRSPDDAGARNGLSRAVTVLVEHELAADDPKAAAALLASLPSPHPELAEKIAAAEREHAKRTAERQRVEAIGRDHDSSVGQRTRLFLASVLGVLWTVSPLLAWKLEPLHYTSYTRLTEASVFFMVLAIGLGIWARESMSKTQLNRAMLGFIVFIPVAQMLLVIGNRFLGLPVQITNVHFLFLWMTACTLAGVAMDRRLLWAAALYAASWLVGAHWPAYHKPLMSLDNLALLILMVKIWRPANLWKR